MTRHLSTVLATHGRAMRAARKPRLGLTATLSLVQLWIERFDGAEHCNTPVVGSRQ